MIVAAFLTFVVTVVLLLSLRPLAVAVGLVDVPGGRKRHEAPVPLIGGICMSLGMAVGTSLIAHPAFWESTVLAVFLLVVVGTIDDRFDLPWTVRLVAQTCATLLVIFPSKLVVTHLGTPLFFDAPLGVVAVPFTVLFVMTLINAFNLIDGLDGLAGGLALLSVMAMAIAGFGSDVFPLLLILIAAVLAFLLFNVPIAFNRAVKTFMGDAGSTFLGMSIAAVGIHLSQGSDARIAPAAGLWFVTVPVFDLFSTILRRWLQGRSPFHADHEHLHHVLTDNGLSRRASVALILCMAVSFACVGLIANALAVDDGIILLGWLLCGVLYYQLMRRPAGAIIFAQYVQAALSKLPTPKTSADPGTGRRNV